MEHDSYVGKNITKPTGAMNNIQVTKSILNTPGSLETATFVAKRETWTETFLKCKITPETTLSTGNNVSTSMKCQFQTLDLM